MVRFQKRESRGDTDALESKAMPGALVSNRRFLFWHLGWKMHTKVVCVSVNTFCSMKKNTCIDLLQANINIRDC